MFAASFGLNSSRAQQPATTDSVPETVLTGCLRSSGADTAIAGPSGRIYTLEVVEPPAKPTATTATGSTPPVASTTTYSLSAAESIGLAKHVDHQVQLTGKMQAPSGADGKPASPGAAARPKPQPGGGHRTFEVTALKMMSKTCSGN